MPLFGWILLGGVAYLAFKSPSGTSSTSAANAQNAAQLNANLQAANAAATFDAQAQAAGLTQAQAQDAYNLGMTPSAYLAQLQSVGLGSGAVLSGQTTSGGPLLQYYWN